MAVNITIKNTEDLLHSLQSKVKGPSLPTLVNAGAKVLVTPSALSVMSAKGDVLASAALNTSALPLLLSNQLALYSEEILVNKLTDLFESAVKNADLIPIPAKKKQPKKMSPKLAMDEAMSLPPKPTSGDAPPLPGTLSKDGKVKLSDADKLYQPVRGSSSESVYHVIALLPGQVAAAVRLRVENQAWSASLRFEGDNIGHYQKVFEEAGVAFHGEYASLHLKGTGGASNAKRAIGAMLFATGIPFTSTATSAVPFINSGV